MTLGKRANKVDEQMQKLAAQLPESVYLAGPCVVWHDKSIWYGLLKKNEVTTDHKANYEKSEPKFEVNSYSKEIEKKIKTAAKLFA